MNHVFLQVIRDFTASSSEARPANETVDLGPGHVAGLEILADLHDRPERCDVLPNDLGALRDYIRKKVLSA